MLQKKNKNILIYFFLFLIIGSINNKNLSNIEIPKIQEIHISGLNINESNLLYKNLEFFRLENLFFLDKTLIEKIIYSNHYVEKFSVFKIYPSALEIKIKRTKLLAYMSKNGNYFLLGSNKKLIKTNDITKNVPFIFGNFEIKDFFNLRKVIQETNFRYEKIEKIFFFPSGRWDLLTKSGTLIKLPKDNLKDSLKLSLKILNDKNFKNSSLIDLRQRNQVITNE